MDSKIKNIIFDWGGVLIDVTLDRFLTECNAVGISFKENEITGTHKAGFFLEYELGKISDEELRNELRSRAGRNIPDAELDRIWNTMIERVPEEKLELLCRLKDKYNLYILSNTNAIHWDNVAPEVFSYKGLGIDDFFKKVFLSHEMHLAKPDTAIYLKALSEAGLKAEETMFKTDIKPCAATIGCFDGVHTGHRYLVKQVRDIADEKGLKSALITFPIHPRQVMQADYMPELLSCPAQKTSLISSLDADYCIVLPFTKELSRLTAREFMELLYSRYNVRALVIGYDHRFGHNRTETFEDYCRYGQELGMSVIKAEPLKCGITDTFISSSAIRKLLKCGDVVTANRFLGYNYYIDGTVTDGHKIGRKIGFPTANIIPSCPEKLIPANGVYAVHVPIGDIVYKGMLNIGNRPTMNNGSNISIEVHIINFNGDIYHHPLRIEFISRIREEIKFASMEELIEQLEKDKTIISKIE